MSRVFFIKLTSRWIFFFHFSEEIYKWRVNWHVGDFYESFFNAGIWIFRKFFYFRNIIDELKNIFRVLEIQKCQWNKIYFWVLELKKLCGRGKVAAGAEATWRFWKRILSLVLVPYGFSPFYFSPCPLYFTWHSEMNMSHECSPLDANKHRVTGGQKSKPVLKKPSRTLYLYFWDIRRRRSRKTKKLGVLGRRPVHVSPWATYS